MLYRPVLTSEKPVSSSPSGDSLLRTLLELQTEVVRGGDPQPALERWLTLLLAETGGEHGVLGVELPAPGAAPRLQVVVSTPPGWQEPLPPSLQGLVHLALSAGQPTPVTGLHCREQAASSLNFWQRPESQSSLTLHWIPTS